MTGYIIRRLLLNLVVVWMVASFVFLAVRILPGDYAAQQVTNQFFSGGAGTTKEDKDAALQAVRERLGMDDSIPVQYVRYFRDIASGDFGNSFQTGKPAWDVMTQALPYTVQLGLMSLLVAVGIAFPVGIISAIRQDSVIDGVFRSIAILGLAAPSFWTASLLTGLVLRNDLWNLNVVNPPGFWEDPMESIQLFIIPSLAGGVASGAVLMRILRSQLLDVLRQDYVRTAWAKGLRERSIVTRHVLRNGMIPVVTVIGFLMGGLVGGSIILEQMFNIPGMGQKLLGAILVRDVPVVQLQALVIATGLVTINLIVDLSYFWIDPRITVRGASS
ncbi:MAG: ABC transporter permease [Dehalococcoidia bacterium]